MSLLNIVKRNLCFKHNTKRLESIKTFVNTLDFLGIETHHKLDSLNIRKTKKVIKYTNI